MNNGNISLILQKQRDFFNSDATKGISFRLNQLLKLKLLIEKNERLIFDALISDLNKSETETYTSEISYVLKEIEHHIKYLPKWNKIYKKSTPLINKPGKSYYDHEPFGISLVISPWNYPFGLSLTPLIGSISAGNCTILKPSELSKHTSSLLKKMINDNFPEDYLNVIEGGPEITQSLINEQTDIIFFTGSTNVGRKIMQKAAEHLIPVVLELGGKNPCIVDDEIDIDVTAKRIVWGKFFNAGQTCVAPDYIIVKGEIKEKLQDRLIAVIEEFYGDDIKNCKDFSHIINEFHFNRLKELMAEGKILFGGGCDIDELFISPTLITEIDFDSKIMKEEIFGPILPILSYENLDEVILRFRDLPKPLAIYFFSRNKDKQNEIISGTSSGNVCINGTIHSVISNKLPFGGIGLSGMGKYHGRYSFEAFSNRKSILNKSFIMDNSKVYPPYKTKMSTLKKAIKYFY